MNDKKNIDRLFQERFKDFESIPDDKIWNHIHDTLHDKKKRRVLPLWWKLSGIAAGFILAFLAFNTLSTTFDNEPAVVTAPKETENSKKNELNSTPKIETRVALEKDDANTNSSSVEEENNKVVPNKSNTNPNIPSKKSNISNVSNRKVKNKAEEKTAFALASEENKERPPSDKKPASHDALVSNTAELSNEKNKVAPIENTTKSEVVEISSTTNSFAKKGTDKSTLQENDSTALAVATEPNPLEEILKKKNQKGEKVLATAKLNRWQVTTNVAPVYFNSASNGSPIESQFSENRKSYENNLSVGVGVQYAVNKKLAVRTGVNKVTLGYGTNDVLFFGALNSAGVTNLSSSTSTENIEIISASNFAALRPFEENLQNMESGVLNQQMGYYEVPLELSFGVYNRKFGVQVIGGMSTLFLNENSVSVQSARTTVSLGKANNLNDVHFSSNIGLGFTYKFWNSFEARFEPTFKYQFNTFSRDAGNFKPYFVGLYTGISFKF